jgi:hypothetical protein
VKLCLCGTAAANGPIVHPPDDTWVNMDQRWDDIDRGNQRTRRKTCPSATLCTTNTTWTVLEANADLHIGCTQTLNTFKQRLANSLSTEYLKSLFSIILLSHCGISPDIMPVGLHTILREFWISAGLHVSWFHRFESQPSYIVSWFRRFDSVPAYIVSWFRRFESQPAYIISWFRRFDSLPAYIVSWFRRFEFLPAFIGFI